MFESRPTVAVATLGCKVNQADSDAYAQSFVEAGYTLVPVEAPADVCVVNTCSVTNVGDQKSRQVIQRMRRANPDALIAVTGCYAALAPQAVERLTGADVVAGLSEKAHLVELVSERLIERGVQPRPTGSPQATGLVRAVPRTRLNVKVQDGCNDFCSYCIVPFTRGRAHALPEPEALAQIRRAAEEGYQEVVITGVNLTTYGRNAGSSLGHLLEAILEQTAIPRIRLSSIEPFKFDLAWLSLWASPRLCRHFHLPLQSGCDATLRRMRRRYDTDWYACLLQGIRAALPDAAVWTDLIAGFPGEDDEEFEASLAFVEAMVFAGIHVFRYSPRTGTRAADLPDQVPASVKRARGARLLRLSDAGKRRFATGLVGTTAPVLFEDASGLTGNYVRVYAAGAQPNTMARVRLLRPESDGLWGEMVG
ncbi:MAG: tRNA (N(6)-L-threonylcarbamoyladenosine(37)-C(2))-methylthiotransferase MtaB [Chloroflexota bacterium]